MIKVAISGNIASGKSVVEKYLKENGYKVIDADKLGHDVLFAPESSKQIKEIFNGYDILDSEGKISREKLGEIVFSDLGKKQQLEAVSHKIIKEKIDRFFIENLKEKVVFVCVPLLFEAGFEDLFDKIVFVSAPEDVRLERLIKRSGYSVEYAQKRIKSQESEESKIKKSDFVIYNNSDFESLIAKVKEVISELN